ncbi:MAG: hypothetical protein ACOYYS_23580 [Chloroflexota bacterium]
MLQKINQWLDVLSNYFAHRKGLLPIVGMVLILFNWLLQFFPGLGWIVASQSFLHLGLLITIIGFLIAWAL